MQIGNLFFGTEGWGMIHGSEFKTFMGRDNKPGFSINWTQMDYEGANAASARHVLLKQTRGFRQKPLAKRQRGNVQNQEPSSRARPTADDLARLNQ